ncbi:MAG: hypothetical protein DYG98_08865 [Haliscomenobacteraceae bacterium CHB4]|nr:hypothetical protein [Saprospiraceae bacterium]MCE7923156.1 hypothetical protein [Haliscomenobacteraceae bacterium CHB4]
MKNQHWLLRTLIQVVAFILIVSVLDRIISPDEFHIGKFLIKTLVGGLIFGMAVGYANYELYKKSQN